MRIPFAMYLMEESLILIEPINMSDGTYTVRAYLHASAAVGRCMTIRKLNFQGHLTTEMCLIKHFSNYMNMHGCHATMQDLLRFNPWTFYTKAPSIVGDYSSLLTCDLYLLSSCPTQNGVVQQSCHCISSLYLILLIVQWGPSEMTPGSLMSGLLSLRVIDMPRKSSANICIKISNYCEILMTQ